MRKKDPKYKEWLKRRLAKKARKKANKRKTKSYSLQTTSKYKHKEDRNIKHQPKIDKTVTAPANFCIRENYEEVVPFFSSILEYMYSREKGENIFFDLSRVERISVDAIIYLLAIIKDLQKLGKVKHNFIGNLPKNEECKQLFIHSGFLNYVNSRHSKIEPVSDMIQIECKNIYDQTVTKKVCDFICEKAHCDINQTKFLYVLINEMMLNTYQHAYKDDTLTNNWYLFVQYDTNIKFTFLDTGLGIPCTVQKKWHEKVLNKKDSNIITSALNGDFRTKTKHKYRGKGLPKIKECLDRKNLNNINIISNKAFCSLNVENDLTVINEINLSQSLPGTIYYWELNLKGEKI